ncbi:EF-hand domain-containing member C2 [Geranomyces michiganensis]|nr:EF-hand domain-containing member C2 [Geranomyces michiganensis]
MRDPVLRALQHKLPFLPGYQFDLDKDRNNERKSHAFDYSNGVPVNKPAPGIGGKALPGQEESKIHTSVELYPHSDHTEDGVPAWVAFDRKVLRFYAYFQEAVHERREEQYRVRKVNIYFYLEDDSVHVSEPKTANSGIPQGTLIRRHRITKPESANGQHYTVADFNVGQEVTFYSRTFKIVGCDQFTKDFLNEIHVRVPENSKFPSDPYTAHRAELQSRMKATRPRPPQTSLKKFLENDRRVLRFYCIWDDTQSVFGDLRHMVVHYYLSDDTIEIREHIPANAGRDANTLFLRRSKLPKRMPVWLYGHNNADASGRESKGEYFGERDFLIGAVLHLYGRPFVVCDCDEFTKEYYAEKYGIETFDPVRIEDYETAAPPAPFSQAALAANYELLLPPSPLTPSTGKVASLPTNTIPMIGSGAPPKKDFQKLMLYDTTTLRFSAALNSPRQVDKDRRFVVSLYVADDTISVFEPKSRNTGLVGGKFLEKSRIRKPDGTGFYGTQDFYIGAELVFFHHPFVVTSADDYAIKFMAEHPDMFPHQQQAAANQHQAATNPPIASAPPAAERTRASPTPAPVLHDWQEAILAQNQPLPFSQPQDQQQQQEFGAVENGDGSSQEVRGALVSPSGRRGRSSFGSGISGVDSPPRAESAAAQARGIDGFNDDAAARGQRYTTGADIAYTAPPAASITARQPADANDGGVRWTADPSAAATAVLTRLRDASTAGGDGFAGQQNQFAQQGNQNQYIQQPQQNQYGQQRAQQNQPQQFQQQQQQQHQQQQSQQQPRVKFAFDQQQQQQQQQSKQQEPGLLAHVHSGQRHAGPRADVKLFDDTPNGGSYRNAAVEMDASNTINGQQARAAAAQQAQQAQQAKATSGPAKNNGASGGGKMAAQPALAGLPALPARRVAT